MPARYAFHLLVLLWLLLLHVGYPCRAQQPYLNAFYDGFNAVRTAQYRYDAHYEHYVALPSGFSMGAVLAIDSNAVQVVRVDLVYTAFRQSSAFDQRQLNLERLAGLLQLNPSLRTRAAVEWNLVEQTGCDSPQECQGYFHGFVIYTEKRFTKADSEVEIKHMEDALRRRLAQRVRRNTAPTDSAELDDAPRTASAGMYTVERFEHNLCYVPALRWPAREMNQRLRRSYRCPDKRRQTVGFRADIDAKGRVTQLVLDNPDLACNKQLHRALLRTLRWQRGFVVARKWYPGQAVGTVRLPLRARSLVIKRYVLPDSLLQRYALELDENGCYTTRTDTVRTVAGVGVRDEGAVSAVLDRNPSWTKSLVVVDVTGSMSPYLTDLLVWLKLASLRTPRTFVFFNDGNDKADRDKPIGHTGGIYSVAASSFEPVKKRMYQAMRGGGGGDQPENNFEALRAGLREVPPGSEAIMVADNYAFPRDARLLHGLPVNLKLILCGTTGGINPKYLALAREYGFSLHTMESDILDLQALHEGETIELEGEKYLVTKHGFKRVGAW
ncbi:hypothetical protein F0P96_09825 [Hymenobacter busanensis]|uniref:Uncharacterized protein n=1 Tax=Hymenobacter busanensis TaxID=2607656 RepID=A0A7L4ZYF0_9BACT|nr:hypothetical protein [Hymenobacter busanensis]KAA9333266.1 hypothetical protein F0P96_09825 [Hymenobacter busanensis]QHJ08057.1 hypothetical protein GUY19_12495 [Hymenobacter busanensis]